MNLNIYYVLALFLSTLAVFALTFYLAYSKGWNDAKKEDSHNWECLKQRKLSAERLVAKQAKRIRKLNQSIGQYKRYEH